MPKYGGSAIASSFVLGGLDSGLTMLMEGFPFSYGVFQKYYSDHEQFSTQSSQIASVGTTTLVRTESTAVQRSLTRVSGIHILWRGSHHRCIAKVARHTKGNVNSGIGSANPLAHHRFLCEARCSSYPHTGPALWIGRGFTLLPFHILPGRVV